jgi:pimeloyl-ACP methyl ester carboxylesterase
MVIPLSDDDSPDARRRAIPTTASRLGDWSLASPPVVLIHGTGGTIAGNYGPVLPSLTSLYPVLGIDTLPDDRSKLELDDLLDALTDAININVPTGPVHVVGYSLGAVVAAALAARLGSRVQALALLGGWVRTDPQRLLRNRLWVDLLVCNPELLARFWILGTYSSTYLSNVTEEQIRAMVSATQVRPGTLAEMDLNRRLNIADRLPLITSRTLVLGGDDDATIPLPHSIELAAGIHGAELVRLPAGHAMMTELPDTVSALLLDFFDGRRAR